MLSRSCETHDMAKPREEAFDALTDEVRRLFHQLAAVVDALHERSASQRAVLERLWRDGDQTVPDVARACRVSRQFIQVLVNELLEAGLVVAVANPAHARSPRIHLTGAGRACFEAMKTKERTLLSRSPVPTTVSDMQAAAQVLKAIRDHLESLEP